MRKLILGLFAASLFASCSTELDINADAQDVTVVFGLLDHEESTHYIKISKAFLTEDNALVTAQDPDALYYEPGAIVASLEEYKNFQLVRTIPLVRDTTVAKDSGVFAGPNQVLFSTDATLDEDARYELVIVKNDDNSDAVRAETNLVTSFSWSGDIAKNNYDANFGGPTAVRQEIFFRGAENGRIFETTLRIHYDEEKRDDPNDVVSKFVDWKLEPVESNKLDGTEELGIEIPGSNFFRFIQGAIPPDFTVWRHPKHIDVTVYAGSDQLNTYINVNGPSNTISQDRPDYTNVVNGLGLFASRTSKTRTDIDMTRRTHDSLRCGQFTLGHSWVSYEWDDVNDVHLDTLRSCQ